MEATNQHTSNKAALRKRVHLRIHLHVGRVVPVKCTEAGRMEILPANAAWATGGGAWLLLLEPVKQTSYSGLVGLLPSGLM